MLMQGQGYNGQQGYQQGYPQNGQQGNQQYYQQPYGQQILAQYCTRAAGAPVTRWRPNRDVPLNLSARGVSRSKFKHHRNLAPYWRAWRAKQFSRFSAAQNLLICVSLVTAEPRTCCQRRPWPPSQLH